MNFIVILFMLLKNIIYGLSVLFTGNLTENLDVLDILALRFLMSFIVLFLLKTFKIIKINIGIKDIFHKTENSKYVKPLLLAGLFEPVLYMFFETLGISQTSSVIAGVIFENEQLFPFHIVGFILIAIRMVGVSYIDIKNNRQLTGKIPQKTPQN